MIEPTVKKVGLTIVFRISCREARGSSREICILVEVH